MVDGRLRIRQLPTDDEAPDLTRFMVIDDLDPQSDEYGVVKWRYLPSTPGGGDCDWTLQNDGLSGPSVPHNVYTAVGASDDCPDAMDAVGIGTSSPKAKLDVFTTTPAIFGGNVIMGSFKTDLNSGCAINGSANSALSSSFSTYTLTGVQGSAGNGKYAYGVDGQAIIATTSPGTAVDLIGVRGMAKAYGSASRVIGVYGAGSGAINPSDDWAAYFDGRGYLTSGPWQPSDVNLKQNVENLTPAEMAAALMQLSPKSYTFNANAYPYMHLPTEPQRGLISQEVGSVFPDLVTDVVRPEQVDTLGNVIEPELHFKAMNYNGFIPILIAGFQAQQQQLDQQQATIAQMQTQLDQCCAANPGMAPGGDGSLKSAPAQENVQEQRLVIHPNPFTDHTTLSYFVPQAGKVSLQVSTSDGKPLGTLREEQAEAGAFTYEWNTSKLASGTYFCTFMLDGAVVVKRAVKVAR